MVGSGGIVTAKLVPGRLCKASTVSVTKTPFGATVAKSEPSGAETGSVTLKDVAVESESAAAIRCSAAIAMCLARSRSIFVIERRTPTTATPPPEVVVVGDTVRESSAD